MSMVSGAAEIREAPQPQEDFAGTSVAGLVMAIMAVTASVASAMS